MHDYDSLVEKVIGLIMQAISFGFRDLIKMVHSEVIWKNVLKRRTFLRD